MGSMDLGVPAVAPGASGGVDLLGGGLNDLLAGPSAQTAQPSTNQLLGDIFGLGGAGAGLGMPTTTFYIPPKQEWLSAQKGKGLEVKGTFSRKAGVIYMDMTFSNRAMTAKNGFGLTPAEQLNVPSVVANQSVDVSLPLATTG